MSLDGLVKVDNDGLIDTNDQDMLWAYRNNLMILTNKALEDKRISDFRIIREDDFFPYDGMWRVNSKETFLEYAPSNLAGAIRWAAAYKIIEDKKDFKLPFPVPPKKEESDAAFASLDPLFGFVLEPVHFRSTKHFTINTPLEYTGSYNAVMARRKFVLIDKMDNFLNSGYGYSIDYNDAYIDVSHENLSISKDAIYLIRDEDYKEMVKDPSFREQIAGKRVIRYKGDIAVAINMVLTSEGVLPSRVNGYDREYVPELEDIFTRSMKSLALDNNIEYSKSHGNIDGRGGHFSDLLDRDNEERYQFEKSFTEYIRSCFPELGTGYFNIFKDAERVVQLVGFERLWKVIDEYNKQQEKGFLNRMRRYDMSHSVDVETHELFVAALNQVKEIFKKQDVSEDVKKVVRRFFHSSSVEEQKTAATEIINMSKNYEFRP